MKPGPTELETREDNIRTKDTLEQLISDNDVKALCSLIDRENINLNHYYFSFAGFPILSYCCNMNFGDRTKMMRKLLDLGAQPLALSRNSKLNILHAWVTTGRAQDFNFIKAMLKENFTTYLNMRDENGRTPIFLASQSNQREKIKILLDNKADLSLEYSCAESIPPYAAQTLIEILQGLQKKLGPGQSENLILKHVRESKIRETRQLIEKNLTKLPFNGLAKKNNKLNKI